MWEKQGDILVNYLLTIPVTICLQDRPEKPATFQQGPTGMDMRECRAPPQREENCTKNLVNLIRAAMLLKKCGKNPALFLNKLAEDCRKWGLPSCSLLYCLPRKQRKGLLELLSFFLASAWTLSTSGLGSVFEHHLSFVPCRSLKWCFWSARFGWMLWRNWSDQQSVFKAGKWEI